MKAAKNDKVLAFLVQLLGGGRELSEEFTSMRIGFCDLYLKNSAMNEDYSLAALRNESSNRAEKAFQTTFRSYSSRSYINIAA